MLTTDDRRRARGPGRGRARSGAAGGERSARGLYSAKVAGLWSLAVPSSEWSWVEEVAYACPCGAYFPARRWRWIDAEGEAEAARRIHKHGPVEGACPGCGREAAARAEWLEVVPSVERATLVLGPEQRGEVLRALQDHLAALARRPGALRPWLLQPALSFAARAASDTAVVAMEDVVEEVSDVEIQVGEDEPDVALDDHDMDMEDEKTPLPSSSAVPAGVGPIQRAAIGEVDLLDGRVVVRAHLDEASARAWAGASLRARPVLLRGAVYPLLGVRLVAALGAGAAVIDGLIDVGDVEAHEVFSRLAERFAVELVIHGARGATALRREVVEEGLERNAALCLESARGLLASGEFAPDAYLKALEGLAAVDADARLRPAAVPLPTDALGDLSAAPAVWAALDRLDQASSRENLSQLLEVDGLPLGAYEGMRRDVLAAAVELGLCPASRFWRRILEGGDGAAAVIGRMAAARAAGRGGDLPEETSTENWFRLRELCDKKRVPHPPELKAALAADPSRPLGRRRSHQPPMIASGEIGDPAPTPAPTPARAAAVEELQQPKARLGKATAILSGSPTHEQIKTVLVAMEEFDDAELLALLPTLAELGPRAAGPLGEALRSPRRELRQSAAILLGLARDSRAIEPLCEALLAEATNTWRDIARALGNYGPRVVGPLCDVIRRSDAGRRERAVPRVARALAEVVLSDGVSRGGPGRHAVEALVEVQDAAIASAAQRALATLSDVSSAGEEIRGERPVAEETAVRSFARRAYEAITTPELEVVEADFEELG